MKWREDKDDSIMKFAMDGDIDTIKAIAKYNPGLLHKTDELGWTVLHTAARYGQLDIFKFLLEQGADMNLLTDAGYSPLAIARSFAGENHPISSFLESIGAEYTRPGH
jgi:ankyrin repeat protein